MDALRITLQILLVVTSLLLVLSILMQKGRGGGVSDMFGGGVSSRMGSSGVAERNLTRITIGCAALWTVAIVLLNLVSKFAL